MITNSLLKKRNQHVYPNYQVWIAKHKSHYLLLAEPRVWLKRCGKPGKDLRMEDGADERGNTTYTSFTSTRNPSRPEQTHYSRQIEISLRYNNGWSSRGKHRHRTSTHTFNQNLGTWHVYLCVFLMPSYNYKVVW